MPAYPRHNNTARGVWLSLALFAMNCVAMDTWAHIYWRTVWMPPPVGHNSQLHTECLITAGLKCATRGIEQHRALLDHLVLWLKTPRCTAVQDLKNFKQFKALLKMFSLMEILEHLFLDELLRSDQTFLWFA